MRFSVKKHFMLNFHNKGQEGSGLTVNFSQGPREVKDNRQDRHQQSWVVMRQWWWLSGTFCRSLLFPLSTVISVNYWGIMRDCCDNSLCLVKDIHETCWIRNIGEHCWHQEIDIFILQSQAQQLLGMVTFQWNKFRSCTAHTLLLPLLCWMIQIQLSPKVRKMWNASQSPIRNGSILKGIYG